MQTHIRVSHRVLFALMSAKPSKLMSHSNKYIDLIF
jgi:hypothetical protein